jgi:hypothetical protein
MKTPVRTNKLVTLCMMAALVAIVFVVSPASSYGQTDCVQFCEMEGTYPVLYFAPEGTTTTLGVGYLALGGGPTGTNTSSYGTGIGYDALGSNTSGEFNTAVGASALQSNTTGPHNTAIGTDAAVFTTTGGDNDAMGYGALAANTTGAGNTAIGYLALNVSTGSSNTAVGNGACSKVKTASNVICIGESVAGSNTSNSTYVAGIYGEPTAKGLLVCVDKTGKLGTKDCQKTAQQEVIRQQQEQIQVQAQQISDLQQRLSHLESLIAKK